MQKTKQKTLGQIFVQAHRSRLQNFTF